MPVEVDIDHLFFGYKERVVLKDICLKVSAGEFIGVIGPNGGGKTTLLRLILGFLKPSSGEILIDGKKPKDANQFLAYVPQSLQFDRAFPLTVMDLVLQGRLRHLPWYGWYRKSDIYEAEKTIDLVGLSEYKKRPFSSLSGGQTQRAIIARALASNPKILILDEPTANVDSKAQAAIYEILRLLKGKMTILMVTHDLEIAVNAVDRVFCVQCEGTILNKDEVCRHYMIGIYHPKQIGNHDRIL
jgi:zinc transport system ATP-binding protein